MKAVNDWVDAVRHGTDSGEQVKLVPEKKHNLKAKFITFLIVIQRFAIQLVDERVRVLCGACSDNLHHRGLHLCLRCSYIILRHNNLFLWTFHLLRRPLRHDLLLLHDEHERHLYECDEQDHIRAIVDDGAPAGQFDEVDELFACFATASTRQAV